MRGAIPPLPQYIFIAWCLVKHRDNFTFMFINTVPIGPVEDGERHLFVYIDVTYLHNYLLIYLLYGAGYYLKS
jgi:hypothetical protein